MREVVTMWRHTKMVVLVALTAGVYAAILIPLKGIPLIPGITELRPANVVPVVFSLLFGPAAAWGSAFGNLIGDFFGTLGLGSIFGFVGNFFYGLVAYKLCGKMGPLSSKEPMEARTGRQIVEYLLLAFLAQRGLRRHHLLGRGPVRPGPLRRPGPGHHAEQLPGGRAHRAVPAAAALPAGQALEHPVDRDHGAGRDLAERPALDGRCS